jgi:hypothetical protein
MCPTVEWLEVLTAVLLVVAQRNIVFGNTVKLKVKLSVRLTKHHVMKTYWQSGVIAPRILWPRHRWRWVVSFTPRPLHPQRKSLWYPLDRSLVGPQSLHISTWPRTSILKMEAVQPPKRWFPTTTLHGSTAQKTTTSGQLLTILFMKVIKKM